MRLRSPVVSDPESRISSAFGAHCMLMAVLLDPARRLASNVVAGQEAVMALGGGGGDMRWGLYRERSEVLSTTLPARVAGISSIPPAQGRFKHRVELMDRILCGCDTDLAVPISARRPGGA